MIENFDQETAPLNDYEQQTLLPVIARCLANKVGKDKAVKNTFICKRMKEAGYNISEVRVRKIINHIRTNGLVPCLVATSAGYYVTHDKEELRQYISSLCSRESAIREVRMAVARQAGMV